jgi:chromosome segregation ATPase
LLLALRVFECILLPLKNGVEKFFFLFGFFWGKKMASGGKKSHAAASTPEVKNDRLALTSALAQIIHKSDGWVKAMEDFKALRQDVLSNLENELQTLKRQREESESEWDQTKRTRRIHMEQELAEFGYEAALTMLKERNQVAIPVTDLDQLREKVKTLEQNHDQELQAAIQTQKEFYAKELTFEKRTTQLQHEKEAACLTSQVESLTKQLTMAKDELKKSEERLDAQRELCKSIAESCKAAPIVQHLGSK